jgi:uncharacterized membrane protein
MESRTKILGHPVHPMLIVLPLGLFIGGVVSDGVFLLWGIPSLASVGHWNIAGGIAGGFLAAVAGALDWLAIPAGTRAKRIGIYHAASNVTALLIFAGVFWTRFNSAGLAPTTTLFTVEVIALAFGSLGGWLGGELVDRLGVGVDNGANLDAPNSITGKDSRAA